MTGMTRTGATGTGAIGTRGTGAHLGGTRAVVSRFALLVSVAAAVVAADQVTKSWAQKALATGPEHVLGPVYLVLTLNSGAAFSLGAGATPVVEAVALVIVGAMVWHSGRLARGGGAATTMVALGLLTGGALSNLADRVFRGHHGAVVDFIQLVSWWPVFNLADAAITVGAVLLVGTFLWSGRAGTSRVPRGGRSNRGPQ